MGDLIELEGYWIDPAEVVALTPMLDTIGPHAEGHERYFLVYLRGSAQLLLNDEASRRRLLELVRKLD